MQDARQKQIINWLQSLYSNQTIKIEVASADASFRRYFRTVINGTSYIIMDAPPEKENSQPFVSMAKLMFNKQVNVPEIIQQDLQQGFLLLTDFGNTPYLNVLNDETVDDLYNDAFTALSNMQLNTPTESLPLYDQTKLHDEMDLFKDWFVNKHCKLQLNKKQSAVLQNTWQTLSDSALAQPQCFVHRDFHSRNLMQTTKNNPGIIDFQDAVNGAITYDLVSLLKDCYIQWPRDKVINWVESYRLKLVKLGLNLNDSKQFLKWFDLMGLQRHIKVLGIFCRLNYRDGKTHYLKDLPLTYHYTQQTANSYPELADFAQLLTDLKLEAHL